MYKVVFDTNIYISSVILGKKLTPLLGFAKSGAIILFVSPDILHEVKEVARKKFGFSVTKSHLLEKKIKAIATVVYPSQTIDAIPHYPPDNRILECCVEIHADYLVTGDKKHLLPLKKFKHTQIVLAQEFLSILEQE